MDVTVAKTYLDDYMMECFRVGDIKLIFLSACDKNHFEKKVSSTNPKEGLHLNNTTICGKASTSVFAEIGKLSYISVKFVCGIPTHWD